MARLGREVLPFPLRLATPRLAFMFRRATIITILQLLPITIY
jgi:hypothetical protein